MARACNDAELEPDCKEARELRIKLAKEYKPTWETIPDLAIAIRTKLDSEIGELVQKLLKTEVVSDLDKDELARLRGAEEHLTEIGYSKKAREMVLEYAKKVEVWKHQS
jgi:predicted Ser/Thr protein kinase